VPLSEDEQRILHEIERRFYEHDPEYAKTIESTTLYRSAGRNVKWAALGFLAGLVILIVSFASSVWLGAFGFVVMLLCAIVVTQNVRKMGRAGWQQMTEQLRAHNVTDMLGDTRRKLRERFKRDGT
jgi:Flp pilus assembly protein TadB